MKKQRVSILSPHGGDGEFGAGGFIHKLTHKSIVTQVVFSLPVERDALESEVRIASKILGVKDVITFDFETRLFQAFRQEILDEMIRIKRDTNPNLVLLPASNDIHQDHAVIHSEGLRAFRTCSILGYEVPKNISPFLGSTYVVLDWTNITAKRRAMSCFKSQAAKFAAASEVRNVLADMRGSHVGVDWAECYETIRWVM